MKVFKDLSLGSHYRTNVQSVMQAIGSFAAMITSLVQIVWPFIFLVFSGFNIYACHDGDESNRADKMYILHLFKMIFLLLVLASSSFCWDFVLKDEGRGEGRGWEFRAKILVQTSDFVLTWILIKILSKTRLTDGRDNHWIYNVKHEWTC